MGDIYIETDENFRVTKIHRMPFDPNNGMGYTRDELEKKGFFVDEIPEPVHQVGRRSIAMYNPDTKSIYYECIGIPMSDKERVDQLENAMNALINSICKPKLVARTASVSTYKNSSEISDEGFEQIGKYLAYQIISGKLEFDECISSCPQCKEIITEVLTDNGIQPK